jgi:hypothetical protein
MIVYLVVLFFLLCIILFIVNRDNIKEKIEPSENFISSQEKFNITDILEESSKDIREDLELEQAYTEFVLMNSNQSIKFTQVADIMNGSSNKV